MTPIGDPSDSAALAAWRALLNAHAAAVERIEASLAGRRLPPLPWYDVLWALNRAPERRLRMFELAREVVISRSWLSRVVDRLEGESLVRRESCPLDRRGSHVVLTDEGHARLREVWPCYERAVEEHFAAHVGDLPALAALLGPLARRRRGEGQCGTATGTQEAEAAVR